MTFSPSQHSQRSSILGGLTRDAWNAIRSLRHHGRFSAAVILTLAAGIGANTAIFSVVDQLLLRPLPYPDGERLMIVRETMPTTPGARPSVSPANWLDWQRMSTSFESLAVWLVTNATIAGNGEPMRVRGLLVSHEFFPTLGVAPLLGRAIAPEEDRPNAASVAVISHSLWQRQFGGDSAIVGRVITMNELPVQVIGVMPAGFRFLFHDVDYWTALRLDRDRDWRIGAGRFLSVVARLKPGVTVDRGSQEMEAIAANLASRHEFNRRTSASIVPLRDEMSAPVRRSLLVLYGAVGLLLVIACVSVGNLILARLISRRRELATRVALGASRRALVSQLVAEALILAIAGGAAGVIVARWGLDFLLALAPPELLPVTETALDVRFAAYAFALSLIAGLATSVAPVMSLTRRPLTDSMRGVTITSSIRTREFLIVAQVALTVVLLCAAGLLVRTVLALQRTDVGVARSGVLTMEVSLPPARYDGPQRSAFLRRLTDSLRQLPGVTAAAAANSIPVVGSPQGGTGVLIAGAPEPPPNERPSASIRVVMPGYFHAVGIPLLRGRDFSDADFGPNALLTFIVNEAFVTTYLRGRDPLSTSLSVFMQSDNPYAPIVGVVGNTSEGSLRDAAVPTVFYSYRQIAPPNMTLFVRAAEPAAVTQPAIAAVRALDANVAVTRVRTIDRAFSESFAREQLSAALSVSFGVIGLLIAAFGLYGLLAFVVSERTKELGIRIALGAQVDRLLRSVMASGLRLVGFGVVVGLAAALPIVRWLSGLLFDVTPYDAFTYAAVILLLAGVAVLAAYGPARRAARVDPLAALRQE